MDAIYRLIKFNRQIKSARLKYLFVLLGDLFGYRHLFIRLDPVNSCNLRCGMCYFSDKEYVKRTKGIFRDEELERIGGLFFPRALQVVIGCGTEPTLHKNFTGVVRMARRYKVPYVGVTTNAQRLTSGQIDELIEADLDELTVSTHGVRKETYEKLMVNASFERFHEALADLEAARKRHGTRKPDLRINYTINEENLDELAEFFDVYGDYTIHTLQLRPMVDVGNTAYKFRSFTPLIPRYKEIVKKLEAQCHERGIIFMATVEDPTYESENKSSDILDAVLRYINPQIVWKEDFDWRHESYREYCRRIGWRKTLLQAVFLSSDKFRKLNQHLTYDVKF